MIGFTYRGESFSVQFEILHLINLSFVLVLFLNNEYLTDLCLIVNFQLLESAECCVLIDTPDYDGEYLEFLLDELLDWLDFSIKFLWCIDMEVACNSKLLIPELFNCWFKTLVRDSGVMYKYESSEIVRDLLLIVSIFLEIYMLEHN